MIRVLPAAAGAVVAAALAAAVLWAPVAVAPLVALLAVLVGLGWPRLLALPSPSGTSAVVAVAGVGATAALVLGGAQGRARPLADPSAAGAAEAVLAALGLSVVLAFLHQILRRDGRPRLAESVAGTVAGAAVAGLATGWLSAAALQPDVVLVGAGGLAAALLVTALPWPQRLTGALALVAAGAAAAAVAGVLPAVRAAAAAVLGVALAVVVGAVDRLLVALPRATSRRLSGTIGLVSVGLAAVPVQLLAAVVGP
ncbi:hypothetical protein [Pseudokineococcus marinus]|uniref:hypothetical protein n=1 Tax=Pseudokineococcus marinus TaxID=351215 RepID=UPI0031D4BEE5